MLDLSGERAEKRRNTEEIDKIISCFGETLMKYTKTFKETLRNEILFCRKGETGMTGVLWCTMAKNHDEHLLRRPGCSRCQFIVYWMPYFFRIIIIYIILLAVVVRTKWYVSSMILTVFDTIYAIISGTTDVGTYVSSFSMN